VNLTIAGFHLSGDVLALGLVTGMVYGILGVGLVLVYRSSRIINFAYGEIGAFGAALLGTATKQWGVPYWIAFVMALATSAGIGAASEVVVIRRLRAAPLLLSVIVTLGLGQLINIFSQIVNTSVGASVTYPQPSGFPEFSIGALLMTPAYTAMLFLTPAIVVVLAVFLRRGRLGIALRASAANADAARMSGMLAGRLSALAWGVGGALAAYTAVLVLPTRGFSGGQFLGPGLLLRGLVCAVVARMTSLPVALLSGVGLGVVEQTLLANYPSGGQVDMVIFVVIVVALLAQRSTSGRGEDKGSWSTVQAFEPLPRSYRLVPAVRRLGWTVAALAALLGLAIPEVVTNADATTFTLIVAFGIVGLSVALITGLGGQLSLGQFAVAGVGATASYWVTYEGAPFVFGPLAAATAAAAVSLVIGLPALRIRGPMLAVTTLAFALAAESWLLEQRWMLGAGGSPRRPAIGQFAFDTGHSYYLVAFAVLTVGFWLARNVWTGGVGRRLRAVRDNEDAARAFAIPATTVKLQAFALAGVLAGLGGAVYGHLLAQQSASAYPVDSSINAAAVSVIGGLGILAGPLLGSLYILGVPNFVPLDNVGLAAVAAGWLFLLMRYPGGLGQSLAPARDRIVDALARRAGLDPARERAATPAGGMHAAVGRLDLAGPPEASGVEEGQALLQAEGLTKRFGGLVAVNRVSLEVRGREILGLIGPNGAGKTTLFELLGGFSRPDKGRVVFQGRDITGHRPEKRARLGLIRSFQDAALFPTLTVHEVVTVAFERSMPTPFLRSVAGLSARSDRRKAARADDLLATLGLLSYRDTKIMALSTGTRRITELACLVALDPVLLLLDEPTSGIAQRESEALGEVLLTVKEQLDLTMVVIEHDIPLLMRLADRVVAMESGEVITVGTPAQVQSDPRVIASYLGTDQITIERSTPTTAPTKGESLRPARCGVTTRSGSPCLRYAGPNGVCAQHRKVVAER
jgi:ABC-type branched-subunit amino acid transport system ATPase component/ABC-type branched-subunit amino acid transport system permease subunit